MELINETVSINDLRLDANNARKHSKKNLDAIANSLEKFGQRKPIVISQSGVIVAGNGTYEAAVSLGWTEIVATKIPADWSEDEIKAYALADNRTAELAEWDSTVLIDQLRELQLGDWNVRELGFEGWDLKTEEEIIANTDEKNIGERYEVVIECEDENEQTSLLLRLSNEGLRVRAIVI